MLLSHRIQLLPNRAAEKYFRQAAGTARFVYNWGLARWEELYRAGLKPNAADLDKEFNRIKKEQFPWMYGEDGKLVASNCVTQRVLLHDLKSAFQRFFKRLGKHPRFKKKGRNDSFYLANTRFELDPERKRIWIEKIGWVRLRRRLRFAGKIMGATISRSADKWLIAIQVEIADPVPRPKSHEVVGVDLGVSALATLSDGRKIPAPAPLRSALKRLRRLQRSFSRMKKGGSNWRKQKLRIARLHRRITGIRANALHQLTAYLTRRYSVIGIEDLNVRGMLANRRLARAIADVGFHEFRRQLEYKASLAGTRVVVADRFLPSSKACSRCGSHKPDLTLSHRIFRCDDCGLVLDRDHNAAINLAVLAGGQSVTAY